MQNLDYSHFKHSKKSPITSMTASASKFDLHGKVALISRSDQAASAYCARLYSARGATVILAGLDHAHSQLLAQQLAQEGLAIHALPCDALNNAEVEDFMRRIESKFGRLDVLLNCTHIGPAAEAVFNTSDEEYERSMNVHVRACLNMSSHAAKLMTRQQGGSIVNLIAMTGKRPGFQQGVAPIARDTLVSMTHTFSSECAPDLIRVNAVLPGLTDGRFASALVHNTTAFGEQEDNRSRGGGINTLAGTLLYLASDASVYTTGACIAVKAAPLANAGMP